VRVDLLHQFRQTHAGDPWYGPARTTLLDGVSAGDAAKHPIPGGHSIWELVLHMTSWTNEVRRRMAGANAQTPVEGDWPVVTSKSESAWADARATLDRAHQALANDIAELSDAALVRRVGDQRDPALGSGVSVGGLLVGIAQHDAYHNGQLALLRRALSER
jgi:uncharacterized damage-inducible protein DinB